jgi:hypothetical protein
MQFLPCIDQSAAFPQLSSLTMDLLKPSRCKLFMANSSMLEFTHEIQRSFLLPAPSVETLRFGLVENDETGFQLEKASGWENPRFFQKATSLYQISSWHKSCTLYFANDHKSLSSQSWAVSLRIGRRLAILCTRFRDTVRCSTFLVQRLLQEPLRLKPAALDHASAKGLKKSGGFPKQQSERPSRSRSALLNTSLQRAR